jgi:hypothetical protein
MVLEAWRERTEGAERDCGSGVLPVDAGRENVDLECWTAME